MTDYGHELLFGTFLTPSAADADRVVALARLTEDVGLDLVSVQDHPYQPAYLDAWTLLSVIAARTTRVHVFPNVANLPLRPPAVLAKSVASLDILSGGRTELGIGAGAFWEPIRAMGGPVRKPAEAVSALDEAIAIIRALWRPGRGLKVGGESYRISGAKPGPFPVHDVGIWIGAYRPRMLRLIGRVADGWLPSLGYAGPDQLAQLNAVIDAAAVEAGRSPSDIRRMYNIAGSFSASGGFLAGAPPVWAEQLAELTLTHGVSAYILAAESTDDVRRFASDVVPAVRELVATERAASSSGTPTGHASARGSASASATASGPTSEPTQPDMQSDNIRTRVSATSLAAVPTPDDGVRRSPIRLWDESTRPTGPLSEPNRLYTKHEQMSGRHLIDVHDSLRAELHQLFELIDQVAAGLLEPAMARSDINAMTMRQNNWTLGTYCMSYCRVVTTHHTLEDDAVFPHLRRTEPQLAPVLDRLQEEHRVIHDVLERVDEALVALVSSNDGLARLREAADLLSDTMLSHLSYEERELVEPLARFGFY